MTINPMQQLQQLSMLRGTQPPIPQQGQPVQDPRMQALQQYMQMKGAQQPPQMPQQMPNGQGGTQPMTLTDQADAVDHMTESSEDAKYDDNGQPIDPNGYFRQMPDDNPSELDLNNELQRENMQRPSYVTSQGQPSPNEEYSDEGMLDQIGKRIDNGPDDDDAELDFSKDVPEAQRQLMKNPSEENIRTFIELHGEENLPEDISPPDGDDPADNR